MFAGFDLFGTRFQRSDCPNSGVLLWYVTTVSKSRPEQGLSTDVYTRGGSRRLLLHDDDDDDVVYLFFQETKTSKWIHRVGNLK